MSWQKRLTLVAAACCSIAMLLPTASRANDAVQVRQPWFRYLLPSIPAGAYMTLENHADAPAVLTGASSPECGSIMLHRSESANGVARMVGVSSVTIPAHGSFTFGPGGYHVMCMQPQMHPGQTVTVTLRFADGSRIDVPFPVRAANAPADGPMPMMMGK